MEHIERNNWITGGTANGSLRRAVRKALRFIAGLGERYLERRRLRLAERRLHSMPDWALNDMGIPRSQISHAVRFGRQRPGRQKEIRTNRREG